MKAKVDPELCTGCGACEETCPEVFELPEGADVAGVKVETVPPELEDKVRQAAEDCPVEAISLED